MGVFQDNAITDAGRELLSHVQMGAVFTPTKIVIGSGYLPAGTTTRTIEEVVTPIQTLTINKKKRSNDSTVVIGGVYSNADVTEDFYFRELGLYAKAEYESGETVDECLYSYGNAEDTADLMPAYTSGQPVERQIDIVTYIGNDTQIDLTIESGVYLTRGDLDEILSDELPTIKSVVPFTIASTGWQDESTGDYAKSLEIAVEDITTLDNVVVSVNKESLYVAAACGLCPTCEVTAGKVKVYAKDVPSTNITASMTVLGTGTKSGESAPDSSYGMINIGYPSKSSTYLTATLLSTGWTGETAPYTYNLTLEGITADSDGLIAVADTATDEQYQAAVTAMLRKTAQAENSLTIKAYGEKPTLDIPIIVRLG